MGTAYCHVLELPAKMGYDGSLYTIINQSLYWGFGHIGGLIGGATVFLAAPILSFLVRKQWHRYLEAAVEIDLDRDPKPFRSSKIIIPA